MHKMFKIFISPIIVMITIILITTMVNECWNAENLGMFGTLAASGSFVLITTHLQHENQSAENDDNNDNNRGC